MRSKCPWNAKLAVEPLRQNGRFEMHQTVAGPPGTNYAVMKKAFDEGWGAVIAKTVSLDSSKVLPC